jgi:hypothetical protein
VVVFIFYYNLLNFFKMKKNILPKVSRTSFTRLSAPKLSEFAHGVITATQRVAVYALIETQVADLITGVEKLDSLNAERFNSGRLDTQMRAIAARQVLDVLQKIALLLEANSNGNADFIVKAGFQCVAGGGAHRPIQLEVPTITLLSPTLVPGQIEIHVAECRGARSFAFEFSYDHGNVWHNGSYATKHRNKFSVNTNQEVTVRTKAIGTSNLVSDFSAPMTCRVL